MQNHALGSTLVTTTYTTVWSGQVHFKATSQTGQPVQKSEAGIIDLNDHRISADDVSIQQIVMVTQLTHPCPRGWEVALENE